MVTCFKEEMLSEEKIPQTKSTLFAVSKLDVIRYNCLKSYWSLGEILKISQVGKIDLHLNLHAS